MVMMAPSGEWNGELEMYPSRLQKRKVSHGPVEHSLTDRPNQASAKPPGRHSGVTESGLMVQCSGRECDSTGRVVWASAFRDGLQ